MSYTIYLIDYDGTYAKLDTEDIQLDGVFQVSDIRDISERKDTVKNVVFKATKKNNQIFGNFFHLNRLTDTSLSTKIGYNNTSIRTVDCLVYENEKVIMQGSMYVERAKIDEHGFVSYNTYIIGKLIEFQSKLTGKYLTDLDLSDLKHRATISNITSSWDTSIEKYDSTTSTFSTVPFALGSGYFYPYADYGHIFQATAANADESKIHVSNFRPAIYVNELVNRIFKAQGYTFEAKMSPDDLAKWNSLVVPNADETLAYTLTGGYMKFAKSLVQIVNNSGSTLLNPSDAARLLPLVLKTDNLNGIINPYIDFYNGNNNIFQMLRTVHSDCAVNVHFTSIFNNDTFPATVEVALVERDPNTSTSPGAGFQVVKSQTINLATHQTLNNVNVSFSVGERDFLENKQIGIWVFVHRPSLLNPANNLQWNVDTAELKFPKDEFTQFTAQVQIGSATPDVIAPMLPTNIKQIDFLSSLMKMFNLYIYTDKDKVKHVVMQKYDDFYAFFNPSLIASTAINWTKKINWSKGIEPIGNLSIPKKYTFTYKEDGDYINDDYKRKYGEVFGTYNFTDAFGIVDEKKVELVFSPSPTVEEAGTERKHPVFYKDNSGNKELMKTNIRLLYYNGVKSCQTYDICRDKFTTAWTTESLYNGSTFPQMSGYYYNALNSPTDSLNFFTKMEYFPATTAHRNALTLYNGNYKNQVTELTNSNLMVVEAYAMLNELDMSQLDFRTPIFIDFGEVGHAYFKLLSVNYQNAKLPSKIQLQKVFIGTES